MKTTGVDTVAKLGNEGGALEVETSLGWLRPTSCLTGIEAEVSVRQSLPGRRQHERVHFIKVSSVLCPPSYKRRELWNRS
jgi:hypothetical protein